MKKNGRFNQGIILMPGEVWRGENKGLFFVGIDFDKELGFKEFCNIFGSNISSSIDELKQKFIIEQHANDPSSIHLYFYSEIPFTDKSSDTVLGIEIKSNCKGLMCATPSYHSETDSRWQIKGTDSPITLKSEEALRLMFNINNICNKYRISYLDQKEGRNSSSYISPEIRKMLDSLEINFDIVIHKGNRHNTLISIANSLLFKYWANELDNEKKEAKKIEDELLDFLYDINNKLCKPEPIPEKELKIIWLSAKNFVKNNKTNIKKNRKYKSKTDRITIKQATEQLMNKYHFLTIEESKDMLFYEDGVYKKGGDIIIEKELELMYGYSLKASHISYIKGHIIRRTYIKSNEFDKDLNIINLRNGLYNIKLNILEPHSHQYPSLNQKTIIYDPNAKPKCLVNSCNKCFIQRILELQ